MKTFIFGFLFGILFLGLVQMKIETPKIAEKLDSRLINFDIPKDFKIYTCNNLYCEWK